MGSHPNTKMGCNSNPKMGSTNPKTGSTPYPKMGSNPNPNPTLNGFFMTLVHSSLSTRARAASRRGESWPARGSSGQSCACQSP
eukprot:544593-Pleurochrysis_carterae.AAC.2